MSSSAPLPPPAKQPRGARLLALLVGGVACGALWAQFLTPDADPRVRSFSHPEIESVLGLRFAGDRLHVISRDGRLFEEGAEGLHPLTEPQPGAFALTAWDGDYVALGAFDLRILDLRTGQARMVPNLLSRVPAAPTVSEGLVVTRGMTPGAVRVHDAASGALLWEADPQVPVGPGKKRLWGLATSAGGLVAVCLSNRILLFEAASGARLPDLTLPPGFAPSALALDPRGNRVAVVGYMGGLCVWALVGREPLLQTPLGKSASSVAFSQLGDLVAVGGVSGDLDLFDLSGELRDSYRDPPREQRSAADRHVTRIEFGEEKLAWAIRERVLVADLPTGSRREAAQAVVDCGLNSYRTWAEAGAKFPEGVRSRWQTQAVRDLQVALTLRSELPAALRESLSPERSELARMLVELEGD